MTTVNEEMIVSNLKHVQAAIASACAKRPQNLKSPRLVAVSKFKPKEAIISAYNAGQRHFGENYIQELVSKATDLEVTEKCKDIQWHFIGHLQKNKIRHLVTLPSLFVMETVDSDKLATGLNDTFNKVHPDDFSKKLNIMIQVNTSGEDEKSGASCDEVCNVVKHVLETCPRLNFIGLMTIGQFGYDWSQGPNPDFLKLIECRKTVCETFNLPEEDVELSMGMSDDFEKAIEMGSTNVRVGTSIFGSREKKA